MKPTLFFFAFFFTFP
ncbi:pheA operon leader peptide PheL [Pantoea eucalypti]|nr:MULTISPECIES: pheA operon leader peptide PheL [Pantoea]QXG56344.1 pheA operon leader peptide PheL [Pantoea jilinensis]MCD2358109.1 pheA operon leader peptide PheL [Pantoea sp. MHSD4]MDF2043889.1 pheA operon leader peptide PheL [Pantoea sp. Cr_R14]MDF2072570.1 pheA operon leader peptide PheL [Pantoea sp. Cr_R13]MDF2078928.1 pheA operon leader peptide PheL [Pantoea sp. Cr_R21]